MNKLFDQVTVECFLCMKQKEDHIQRNLLVRFNFSVPIKITRNLNIVPRQEHFAYIMRLKQQVSLIPTDRSVFTSRLKLYKILIEQLY